MLHEMPLVIFTIAAQLSAGSFVVLGLIHLFGARVPQKVMDRVTDPALYAIGPLLVLGLAASTFHLGSPLRAPNAMRHLSESWLSREIVAGIVFVSLGALFAILQWFKWGNHRLRQVLAVLTAAVGVFLVFAISKVYSLRTVPAWSTFHTPLRFYITTFLLGGLAVGTALVVAHYLRNRRVADPDAAETRLVEQSIRGIALGGIVAMGLKFVALPAYIAYLGTHEEPAAQTSLHLITNVYGGWQAASTILVFLGVMALGVLLFRLSDGKGKKLLPVLAVTALILVFAGEFVARMIFYASMVRVGM